MNHKQGSLVPLLNKRCQYACVYSRMVSHAIAQKITIQPLQLTTSTLQCFLIIINNNYAMKTLIQLH